MKLKQQPLKILFIQYAQDYSTNICAASQMAVISTREALYISKEAVETLNHHPSKVKQIVMRNFLSIKQRLKSKIDYSIEKTKDGKFLKTISIYSGLNEKTDGKLSIEDKFNKIRCFDLAVAQMVSGVTYSRNPFYSEAFAALMHIKRFGKTGGFVRNLAYEKAKKATCGDVNLYTSGAVFAVEKLAKTLDVEKTSHKDLVVYAGIIASFCQLEEKQKKEISKAYTLPRAIYKVTGKLPLRLIAKTILAHKSNEEIYRAGRIVISGHEWDLQNEKTFWKKALASMEEHERATGFVLNPIEAMEKKFDIDCAQVLIEKKSRHRSRLVMGKNL